MKTKILFLTVLLYGCSPKFSSVTGYYLSYCLLYGDPGVQLNLYQDSTFRYKFAQLDKIITGTWSLNRDTVILHSSSFDEKYNKPLMPIRKNTNLVNVDMYIVKKGKLYEINKDGLSKRCYLTKYINQQLYIP